MAVNAADDRRAAVFLDKDGTVLEDLPYNVDPARMRLAPGAADGLALLGRIGCPLIVVSNQAGVARGRFAESALAAVGAHLGSLFAACGARLDGFYWCPHDAEASAPCDCRKPAPGLLLRAAQTHALNPQRSWMIGDILDDIEAGHRAGCRSVLLDNGNETEWRDGLLRRPDARVTDLAGAARLIAAGWEARICAAH